MKDKGEQFFNEGVDFFHHGDYAKAIASFDKTIAINQNNAEVWCGGGLAQGALRRWTDAVSSFDEASTRRLPSRKMTPIYGSPTDMCSKNYNGMQTRLHLMTS